jgi:putative ATPase
MDDDIKIILANAVERISPSDPCRPPSNETMGSQSETSSPTLDSIPSSAPSQASSVSLTPYPSFPQLTSRILASIVSLSAGDARTALSLLDLVLTSSRSSKEDDLLSSLRRSVSASYDRAGESHYNMISALHKSVRGSQGSAAMYWLARMLNSGEDPLYIARRMVVCASEDVGLADNHALPLVRSFLLQYIYRCLAWGLDSEHE